MSITLYSALLIRGTVTEIDDDNPAQLRRYVYQRVAPGLGHRRLSRSRDLQRRRHVIPADPATPYQLALRARFAAATANWHTLTDIEKDAYRERANENRWTRFNEHIRAWCRTHYLNPADYPDPITLHPIGSTLHRPGALPGVARVTNARALAVIATHPHQPPDAIPPLHINPKILIHRP